MKVHLISDVHTEMDKKLKLTAPADTDVIVLAGIERRDQLIVALSQHP